METAKQIAFAALGAALALYIAGKYFPVATPTAPAA